MDALTVDRLADILQEPNRPLLALVLRTFGPDRTVTVLTETLQCEANGGMLTKDGTRRRTPGGVFFQLVRQQATPQERRRLFPHPGPQPERGQPQGQAQRPLTALTWDEVPPMIQTLATDPAGEARTMKLTLIGRPGKVETKGQAVMFRLQGKPPASLPRGLPPVPAQAPLTWNVIVAQRQWNRVTDSLAANPEDQLIIEGYPAVQGTDLVLLAQSCTSIALQRAQKAAQRQEPTS
jgi:PHAX RNA-binding domain-containing protein